MEKRYYWLKLKENFFDSPHLKAMRKLPGGTELCVIYLKMMLQSIKNNGILLHTLASNSFSEELSFVLGENANSVEMVLHFLNINKLIEQIEDKSIVLTEAQNSIGSESKSAERMRKKREKDKQYLICQNSKKSQCDRSVTRSHCDRDVTADQELDIDKENSNIQKQVDKQSTNKIKQLDTPIGDINKANMNNVVTALAKIGINEAVAVELFRKYGTDKILISLRDMQNRKGIFNPGGYLIRMLEDNWPLQQKTREEIENNKRMIEQYQSKTICQKCNKWNDEDWLCQKDGRRYDFSVANWIECEYCEVLKNEQQKG